MVCDRSDPSYAIDRKFEYAFETELATIALNRFDYDGVFENARPFRYALLKLKMSGVSRAAFIYYDEHNVFVWLPTGYGKSLCYQALHVPFGLADTE